jgi:hypothetical protein
MGCCMFPTTARRPTRLRRMERFPYRFNFLTQRALPHYALLNLSNPRAKEFATQGYPRRLKVMVRCMDNVFTTIPPDRETLPSRDELSDATLNIQSFVFNVFGSIDNLAWIWVSEKGQKRADGTPKAGHPKHPSDPRRRTSGAAAASARAGTQVTLRVHLGTGNAVQHRWLRPHDRKGGHRGQAGLQGSPAYA